MEEAGHPASCEKFRGGRGGTSSALHVLGKAPRGKGGAGEVLKRKRSSGTSNEIEKNAEGEGAEWESVGITRDGWKSLRVAKNR